jgi:uncharacterized membrane protein
MSIFPIFKAKPFFNHDEKLQIVNAIRHAEQQTSGEIRVYVESKNPYVDPMDRAAEVFYDLKMDKTEDRNAVLLYIAMKHRELALFGDEGIYTITGASYWNNAVKDMLAKFSNNDMVNAIVNTVEKIGETLQEKFPYDRTNDKNELPDDIVFGK